MKKMYMTGDIVKEIDGKINFLGRKDYQIKHMGYRIELEEIENALIKISGVNQVVVLFEKENSSYGKLFSFLSVNDGINEKKIKTKIKNILPAYMIPHKFFMMDSLPKNPNGKIDRPKLRSLIKNNKVI